MFGSQAMVVFKPRGGIGFGTGVISRWGLQTGAPAIGNFPT